MLIFRDMQPKKQAWFTTTSNIGYGQVHQVVYPRIWSRGARGCCSWDGLASFDGVEAETDLGFQLTGAKKVEA